jgi:hypothetical protein
VITATSDWEEGFYPIEERNPRHNLAFDGTLHIVGSTLIRAVNVTDEVRQWVEDTRPNNGFVFQGNESFSGPPVRPRFGVGVIVSGERSPFGGLIWRRCMAILTDFRLEFHNPDYRPPGSSIRVPVGLEALLLSNFWQRFPQIVFSPE